LASKAIRFVEKCKKGYYAVQDPIGGLGTTYDVHLGLIAKRIVDFVLVLTELFSLGAMTKEALQAKINQKSAISLQCGQFNPEFQVEWVTPHQPFFFSEN